MNKIRLAAIPAVVGLLLTLAACSGSSDDGDGKTNLVVWDANLLSKNTEDGKVDTAKSFLHQAAAKFESENPNVTVEIVGTPGGDLSAQAAQFQAASIAGEGPDIRTSFTGGNTLSFGDFLLDLDGTFDDATVKDLSGWNTVRKGYAADGPLLGLPYGGGSYFYVFYNKELAQAAGLDLSKAPSTWEQFLNMAQQAKDAGQPPVWVANQEGYVGAWVISALAGGELGTTAFTDMYSGKIKVDDPAMVKAYKAYDDLYGRGLTNPDAGSVSNGQASAGFIQGKGTFYISGSWENSSLVDAMGDNVGVFPIPMLAGAKYPNTASGGPNVSVSITNYSKHQDVAKDFLRFLAKPEIIDLYVKLFQTEASNSAQADPSVITNPLLKAEAEYLKDADAVVFPFDSVMPQAVTDLFYRLNTTTFLGRTTAEDAVSQLSESAATELAAQ